MKQKLVLSFTAQALSLALYRAAPTNQSGGAMGWLLSLLESSAGTARAQPLAQVDVALDRAPTALSQAMDQAWLGLQHKLGGKLQGIVFEAQLGQAYARLDLLELAEGAVARRRRRRGQRVAGPDRRCGVAMEFLVARHLGGAFGRAEFTFLADQQSEIVHGGRPIRW